MAEETLSPISAAKPPVANPISPAGNDASTLKLKPVLRKPTPGGAPALNIPVKPVVRTPAQPEAAAPAAAAEPKPAAEVPKALDQLKSVTQKLKGVTQELPQQAILRKTGIISDQAMTEAQKQASKARTARISLSDAIGAAPVKEKSAPMKTIRIKRPVDIPTSVPTKPAAPVAPAAEAVTPPPAAAESAASEAATVGSTVTQRKTLKVARPGGPKPGAKFSVKKPGAAAPVAAAVAEGGDVADIADIPDMPTAATNVVPAFSMPQPTGEKDVPVVVGVLSLIVQTAACVAIGALGYMLYTDLQTAMF